MKKMVDYIVFDLDGTLIDTLKGLTIATNNTLKELGINIKYTSEEVKTFIGRGAKNLLRMALKRDFTDEEFELFLKNYEKNQYVSRLYNNVESVLKELNTRNIPLIIYSNKPNDIAQKIVNKLLSNIQFTSVQGKEYNYPPKPDVTLLNDILTKHNLSKMKGLYVGDSIIDILTANNASLPCLILTYGYGNREEMDKEQNRTYIDDFKEILNYL